MKKKYKFIVGILILLLVSLYYFFNPTVSNFFPKCPFHTITGLYCPGCGSQRAVHDLMHLNIFEAINHNALMFFTFTFGIGLYSYSKKKFSDLIYHPKSPLIIFGIIFLFGVLRNLDEFHFLAP
ncbi:MAG: DUF2752 domain-containing protein [Flavobacteriaceae bacterium]|nr:DUF2752 domain-containing protein [Flavobacteriaceae bacterium]MDG2274277.1 DUF2752 domain-containing protein [Flavobacteriaceae bacterium]